MKLLIVICAVVVLLQLAAIGRNVASNDGERPSREAIENGEWDPAREVPAVAKLEALLDRFRTRLDLPWDDDTHAFAPGPEQRVEFGGGANQRVAKFELVSGTGVSIRYECGADDEGCRPQVVCLCLANEPVVDDDFAMCGDSFRTVNGRCPADGHLGEIVVREERGALWFAGLGALGGTLRQR